jgi:hypothetical protein
MEGIKFTIALLALFAVRTGLSINLEISASETFYGDNTSFKGFYLTSDEEIKGVDKFSKPSFTTSYLTDINDENYSVFFNIKINDNAEQEMSPKPSIVGKELHYSLENKSCQEDGIEFNFHTLKIDCDKKKVNAFFILECKLSSSEEDPKKEEKANNVPADKKTDYKSYSYGYDPKKDPFDDGHGRDTFFGSDWLLL